MSANEPRSGAFMITGAAGGIGSTLARAAAAAGHPVVLVGRRRPGLEAAQATLAVGAPSMVGVADARDVAAQAGIVADAVERFGRIDALIACAATHGPEIPLEATELADVEETLAVNVIGIVAVTKAVLPVMRRQGAGNLVFFSSGAGHPIPRAAVRSLSYQLSKFAVEGLVDGLTVELRGTGINVNGFRPGRTLAGANLGRGLAGLRRPEQAVEPVLFLASLAPGEMSGYVLESTDYERGFRPIRRDYTAG